ncbi:hypothetical protein KEM54_005467 [Ascosphaera aggregata]|nr:hypothetical protein KEM54_005467 [Ascosphaera aggregata]
MPDSISTHTEREGNPFSRANPSRRGLRIEIKLEDEKSVNSFTTLDAIKGAVIVTPDATTSVDGLLISFEEQPSVVAPPVGRSTAFHTFLRLVQPLKKSQYPEGGIFEKDETYTFPFTFVVPEYLLPQACAHEHSVPQVHEAHTHLPPSLGDPTVSGNGRILLDDLSPDTCHIQYVIRVQFLRSSGRSDRHPWVYNDGSLNRHVKVVATANKRVRVVPATDEEPPLVTEASLETEYCLQKEKEIKKGALRGRSGCIVMAAAQPRAFKIKNVVQGDEPPSTVVTVHLRFDPAEAKQKPPKLGMLSARLKVNTFYSALPWTTYPEKTFSLRWDTKRGVYTETVPLASMRVANAEWERHEPVVPNRSQWATRRNTGGSLVRPNMRRSFSAGSAMSSETETSSVTSAPEDTSLRAGIPSPASKADPSLPYYTASIVVPLVLSEKSKTFLPTFHSCLTSRTYVLDLAVSYHPLSKTSTTILNAPSISLKVPVQITTERSLTELSEMSARDRETARESRAAAREARRQRVSHRASRHGAVVAPPSDVEEFFVPRPVGPVAALQTHTNAYAPALARGPSSAGARPAYRSDSIRGRRPTVSEAPLSPLADTTPSFDPTTPFDPTGSLRSRRNRANTVSSTMSGRSDRSDVSQQSNASTLPPEYSNRPDTLGDEERDLLGQSPTATMKMFLSIQHRLLMIISVAVLFIGAELTVGFQTHSLAVVADAFHYLGDLITFAVSYIVERTVVLLLKVLNGQLTRCPPYLKTVSKKRNTCRVDFTSESSDDEAWWEQPSIERIDALAGFFNGSFLFALGMGIMLQGVERFVQPEELVNPMMVMIMGCAGLGMNIIAVLMLGGHHHSHFEKHDLEHKQDSDNHCNAQSWSIKSVTLHILCDAMNNAALILAATLIWKLPATGTPDALKDPRYVDPKNYADPACTIFIAMIIMVLSVRLIRDAGKALLRHGPTE